MVHCDITIFRLQQTVINWTPSRGTDANRASFLTFDHFFG